MNSGKYIVGTVRDGFLMNEVAILFPDFISHHLISSRVFFGAIVSGGFYTVDGENVAVYGKSISAKVESREADVRLIKRTLGLE